VRLSITKTVIYIGDIKDTKTRMKKQSSIEWLVEQIASNAFVKASDQIEIIQQAKQMHKQEIIDATMYGWRRSTEVNSMHPNEYYENTYETTT